MILVTGATGDLGPYVVRALLDRDAPVRVVARDPAKAGFGEGVEVVAGDLSDAGSLAPAMAGVSKVFMLAPSNLAPTFDANIVPAAAAAGVEHLVKISGLGVESGTPDAITRWHLEGEQLVRDSGLAWTFIRPGEFMTNTLYWAWGIKATGQVREPYGEVKQALVDPRDIAEVAATVLTTDGHEGHGYPLTGPQALSARDRTAILAEIIGRPLTFVDIDVAEANEKWLQMGAPQELIDGVLEVLRSDPGPWATVRPTVQELLGRPAKTFEEFVRDHKEAFA